MVFPSYYEGFGMPVCDALLLGIPAITSNRTSTVEFEPFGAIMVDPDNPQFWDDAIKAGVCNEKLTESCQSNFQWTFFLTAILLDG